MSDLELKKEIDDLRHNVNEIRKEFLEFKNLWDSVKVRLSSIGKIEKMNNDLVGLDLRLQKMENANVKIE